MEDKHKHRESKVRVTDRRKFDSVGNPRDASDVEPEPAPEAPRQDTPIETDRPEPRLPEKVTFDFFIQSLHLQTIVLLGDLEDPTTGQRSTNLDAARFNIDVLGVLQEKTRGNLEPDEENHLQGVLYDLRMRFARKAPSK